VAASTQPNIYNLANFVRAVPDNAVLTLETSMLNVLPINMMAIAMGLHVRCGIEDNIWTQDRKAKMSSVQQIEQVVRISREFGREIAGRQRSARDLPHRRVLQDRRRGPRPQRLRPQPQAPHRRAARGRLTRWRQHGDHEHGTRNPHARAGGPDVLRWEEVAVGTRPGPGRAASRGRRPQLRRHVLSAPALSRAAAERHRRRGAGVVEAVGEA
jgi:hypothetical protein